MAEAHPQPVAPGGDAVCAVAPIAPSSLDRAAMEVRQAALKVLDEKMSHLTTSDQQCAVEAIRELVMRDIEQKVSEKTEELWQRGAKALNEMHKKHKDQNAHLAEEVERCRQRQQKLEAENERLKAVVTSLANRFSLLGAVFGGKGNLTPTTQDAAGVPGGDATTATPQTEKQSPDSCSHKWNSPVPTFGGVAGEASESGFAPLPEVPAFPLLSQTQSPLPSEPLPAPPLSLADALGAQTPKRTPLSLANSLSPTAPIDAHPPCAGGGCFSFTLRKADGADLGLNVSHHANESTLRVEGVRDGGAVEAWNRQCAGTPAQEKAVVVGDKIISVNAISGDPRKMLDECRDKLLLRLTVVRGDRPYHGASTDSQTDAAAKSTTLRADASVFVPMSAGTQPNPNESDAPAADEPEPEKDDDSKSKV